MSCMGGISELRGRWSVLCLNNSSHGAQQLKSASDYDSLTLSTKEIFRFFGICHFELNNPGGCLGKES